MEQMKLFHLKMTKKIKLKKITVPIDKLVTMAEMGLAPNVL